MLYFSPKRERNIPVQKSYRGWGVRGLLKSNLTVLEIKRLIVDFRQGPQGRLSP